MNVTGAPQDRHLSVDGLERLLGSGVPILYPISGEPSASLFIEPAIPELGLRVHDTSTGRLPQPNLQNVFTRRTRHKGRLCLEVVVTDQTLFRDAYTLLCAMADRVQVDKLSPSDALLVTLRKLSQLLRQREGLSLEREIGLFGELLLLGGLINSMGATEALNAWRGGDAEEHDFGLHEIDVEVKTTMSERRVHWIESLTQLVATGERPLWLVSNQLTTAGIGHGMRLPELIELVRLMVGTGAARDTLEAGLTGAGWTDDFAASCASRWTKRTATHAYQVAEGFPRLTPDALTTAGVALAHVPEVKYRIDLGGLPASDTPPETLRNALGFEGRQ